MRNSILAAMMMISGPLAAQQSTYGPITAPSIVASLLPLRTGGIPAVLAWTTAGTAPSTCTLTLLVSSNFVTWSPYGTYDCTASGSVTISGIAKPSTGELSVSVLTGGDSTTNISVKFTGAQ